MKPFFLGVVGSRKRNNAEDFEIVKDNILSFHKIHKRNLIIVSGGCKDGADNFAELVAKGVGIPTLIFYPDKSKLPITGNYKKDYAIIAYERNTEIAKYSDTLIAAVCDARVGGTEDTIKKFKKYRKGHQIIIL